MARYISVPFFGVIIIAFDEDTMSDQSAFSKKRLETINIEKRDWMEELNLPPQLIKFVRKNTRNLQFGLFVLVLAFISYQGGKYYFTQRLEKSTTQLTQAAKIDDQEGRKTALADIVAKYGGTDAGLWARIDLAQLAYDKGDLEGAITYYQAALDETDRDSSIIPLLEYGLAIALEQQGKYAEAAKHFNVMREFKGFERQAWLSLGRISEKEEHAAAAIAAYEKVLALDGEGGQSDDWLAERVRSLKGSATVSDPQSEGTDEK